MRFTLPYTLRAFAACIALGMTTSMAVQAQDSTREEKLEELRQTIEQLKSELETVRSNRSSLLEDLESSENKISELQKKAQELKGQINASQAQLRELRREKGALASVKKQQQRQVSEHLTTAYKIGQQSHLKLLLNQRDPASLSRNLKYFDYIASARATQIAEASATIDRLNKIEPSIEQEQHSLARNSESLRQQQLALKERNKERQQTLAKLEAIISDKDEALRASERDRQRLQNLVERVVRVSGDLDGPINTKSILTMKGHLPWPADGPVVHKFDSQRVSKIRWQGVLIGAESDSPVTAVHYGHVIFSDYLRGHGLLMILDHGHGMLSLYAHNKALYKELGEWVDAGEIIASVGNTGGQAQAGLYFELRENGTPTNPHRWLKKSA